MGVLDDAIREHLDLRRKHGAPEEELRRQEEEALGPARREAGGPEEEGGDIAAEAPTEFMDHASSALGLEEQPGDGGDATEPSSSIVDEPLAEEPPEEPIVDEPLEEPFAEEGAPTVFRAPEPPEPLPEAGEPEEGAAPLEPPLESASEDTATDPWSEEDEAEPEALREPGQDTVESPAADDTPPRGFPPVTQESLPEDDAGFDEQGASGEQSGPPSEPDRGGDVLEEAPDFVDEPPEHERLWFEQKPPRGFDFD
jgi:hypothetical protein